MRPRAPHPSWFPPEAPAMKLTHRPLAWLRRVPRPLGGHALPHGSPDRVAADGADSISQVLKNTTLCLSGSWPA